MEISWEKLINAVCFCQITSPVNAYEDWIWHRERSLKLPRLLPIVPACPDQVQAAAAADHHSAAEQVACADNSTAPTFPVFSRKKISFLILKLLKHHPP
jgi:hypothetical protein